MALADRGQLFGECSLPVIPDSSIFNLSIIVLTMTAGCSVVMWLGEMVTERGIGNGMSLLIFASIASRIPAEGANILRNGGLVFVGVCFFGLAIIASVVFVEQAQRRIPVQYAKRMVGRRMYGGTPPTSAEVTRPGHPVISAPRTLPARLIPGWPAHCGGFAVRSDLPCRSVQLADIVLSLALIIS